MTDETLGVALKKLRAAAGMTQEELADRAGISARTVSDVERGLRRVVHGDTARRLAAALGLSERDRARFDALARGAVRTRSRPAICRSRRRGSSADRVSWQASSPGSRTRRSGC